MVSRRAHIELSEQMAVLNATMQALVCDNTKMRAELNDLKCDVTPPPEFIALKAAPRGQFTYECIRSWCENGVIDAKKEGGRWFVSMTSLSAHLRRLAA